MIPPGITRAVINAATGQDDHENTLRSRIQARQIWRSLWPSERKGQGLAYNSADAVAAADAAEFSFSLDANVASDPSTKKADIQLFIIEEYLKDLGSLSQGLNR